MGLRIPQIRFTQLKQSSICCWHCPMQRPRPAFFAALMSGSDSQGFASSSKYYPSCKATNFKTTITAVTSIRMCAFGCGSFPRFHFCRFLLRCGGSDCSSRNATHIIPTDAYGQMASLVLHTFVSVLFPIHGCISDCFRSQLSVHYSLPNLNSGSFPATFRNSIASTTCSIHHGHVHEETIIAPIAHVSTCFVGKE